LKKLGFIFSGSSKKNKPQPMDIHESFLNEFMISTDKGKLDFKFIHNYLCFESYWAKNIPATVVEKSIDGSCCFGLFVKEDSLTSEKVLDSSNNFLERRIGFARVVTDQATFGYLADVFIVEQYRGKGLSKWLMKTIMNYEALQGLRRWLLATKDAHGLYAKFGFSALDIPELFMGFKAFDEYPVINS
jgi:GNAT superfamily N-acetyltransferase